MTESLWRLASPPGAWDFLMAFLRGAVNTKEGSGDVGARAWLACQKQAGLGRVEVGLEGLSLWLD